MSASDQVGDFESVKARLAEIAEIVEDESLSLDEALDLYEEAVTLGLKAGDLLETGIEVPEEEPGGLEEPGESGKPDAVGGEAQASPGSSEQANDQA